ncbi:MAG TPA: hypothetical protein VIV65_00415 [Gemmatimonadaceae bacterium]
MTSGYFPKHTGLMKAEVPGPFRRLSWSIVEMGLITGVLVRVYRSLVLTHGSSSLLYIGTVMTVALLFVIGMATAHLANFPLNHWLWRVPAFIGFEVLGEMGTSLILIWLAREPNGTVRAHFDDWPGMMIRALLIRGVVLIVWSLALASIVQLVRTRVHDEPDEAVS